MEASLPKQFLILGDKPVVRHSLDVFLGIPQITEVIVVCLPEYRGIFDSCKNIRFAEPGNRRQDSVYNGFLKTDPSNEIICIHDAARPFINNEIVLSTLKAGEEWGAATVGMPITFTIKKGTADNFVESTPDRNFIWEIQTPQVLHRTILAEGFAYAQKNDITVSDDVSLAELINKKVKLVEGSHMNFKLTTPKDLAIANVLLQQR